ncbi:MAG: heterodisulfide reductase-related iron-sulfur binding cluster [Thermoleophilia bacterium]
MEKRLLFPGCLVLARFQDYELSAKAVLGRLGIELLDMDGQACCSSSIVPPFSDDWVNMAAYNMALAEKEGLDMVTLCGSCTRTLKLAEKTLRDDPGLWLRVNQRLDEMGLNYCARVQVRHIIQVLDENQDRMAGLVSQPLDMRVALSHPCNVIRPAALMKYDDPWKPRKMREIAGRTGATVVDYELEYECCGATLLMVNRDWAVAAATAKLKSAMAAGAEALVVSCGNCELILGRLQDEIRRSDPEVSLPVLFLPQLVGRAMGMSEQELGLERT